MAATIGARFRALRNQLEINQQDFADRVGIGRTQIVNIENDRTRPSIDVLLRTADEFSVSVDWLVGRDKD